MWKLAKSLLTTTLALALVVQPTVVFAVDGVGTEQDGGSAGGSATNFLRSALSPFASMAASGVSASGGGGTASNPYTLNYTVYENKNYTFTVYDKAGNTKSVTVRGTDLNIQYYKPVINTVEDLNQELITHKTVKIMGYESTWGPINGSKPPAITKVGYAAPGDVVTWIPLNGGVQTNGVEAFTGHKAGEFYLDNMSSGSYTFYLMDFLGTISEGVECVLVRPPYNFAVSNLQVKSNEVAIDSVYQASVDISASGMSEDRQIKLEWMYGDVVIASEYVEMGPYMIERTVTSNLTAPSVKGPFALTARINNSGIYREFVVADNSVQAQMKAVELNLGLLLGGAEVEEGGLYGYPSTADEGTFVFSMKDPAEKIDWISYMGKKIEVADNKYSLQLSRLEINESVPVRLQVSALGGYKTKEYNITLTKYSGDVSATVTIASGDYEGTIKFNSSNPTQDIYVPVAVTRAELRVFTDNQGAVITKLDGSAWTASTKNMAVVTRTFSGNKIKLTYSVAAQDGKLSQEYVLNLWNNNFVPSFDVVNGAEINNGTPTTYGLNGVERGSSYIPYGSEVTGVAAAINSGATNGIVVQVKPKDLNTDQYLKGYVELQGKKYPISWNSFTGPTIAKTGDVKFGYAYIRITESIVSGNNIPLVISLQDYSDEYGNTKVSADATAKTLTINVANRGPVVTILNGAPPVEGATETTIKAMINGISDFTDYDVKYQFSKDNGRTYTAAADMPASELVVKGSGVIMVKISATDKMNNTGEATTSVVLAGTTSTDELGVNVYVRKTRVADYYFIGTNKNSDGAVNPDSFDFPES